VEDTNLYSRGGEEGAAWAKEQAKALLPNPTIDAVEALDDAFIEKNLSPGGCADLLAATLFLHKIL
jgi:triphosphoribosyl-dephospho-CoA synthetase